MTVRELLEARRADLASQIDKLTARLAEIDHLLALTADPRVSNVTTARNPRTIKREQS